jgi:hypothetical protein
MAILWFQCQRLVGKMDTPRASQDGRNGVRCACPVCCGVSLDRSVLNFSLVKALNTH